MNCLRCGRETSEDHVFCDSCREEMEKYPVRPGTAVMLPRVQEEAHPKKTKRHVHAQIAPEDLVRKLKRQRAWLITVVIVLILAVGCSTLVLLHNNAQKQYRPGQNYSAIDPTATEATS